MTNVGHLNLPKPGIPRPCEPIRSTEQIKMIKKQLKGNPRDLLLFTMGINSGLRVNDLLKLKVKDVKYKAPNEELYIKESKTGKTNFIVINHAIYKVLWQYIRTYNLKDDNWLFASTRFPDQPLIRSSVSRLIKKWTREAGMKGRYSCHTLRKTWGYIQRTKYKVGWELICKRYNHGDPAVTMRYLGITQREVNGILRNPI